jgi:hypothetical protein
MAEPPRKLLTTADTLLLNMILDLISVTTNQSKIVAILQKYSGAGPDERKAIDDLVAEIRDKQGKILQGATDLLAPYMKDPSDGK